MINIDNCGAFLDEKTAAFALGRVGEATSIVMHPVQIVCATLYMNVLSERPRNGSEFDGHSYQGRKIIPDKGLPPTVVEFRNANNQTVCLIKNLACPKEAMAVYG